jgi:hypothetical protein
MKRSPCRRGVGAAFLACLLLSSAVPAAGQSIAQERRAEAAVSGIVRDSSGAGVPRATIVIRPESGDSITSSTPLVTERSSLLGSRPAATW